ncbi:MAG: BMP family protein [Candidatus Thorarchaeota archaeon]
MVEQQRRPPVWVYLPALFVFALIVTLSILPILPNVLIPTPVPHEVAIVFDIEGLGDRGINDACFQGAVDAHNHFNINFTFVESNSNTNYELLLRAYAEHIGLTNPYDLIIAVGWRQAAAVMAVAYDYPNQTFAIVDGYINPIAYPNVCSILFAEEEGSALVGALAGLYTATNKIGFIGSLDIPLIRRYAAGYFWGANLTNPTLDIQNIILSPNISIGMLGDWNNPNLAEIIADTMYNGSHDIIYTVAGQSDKGVIDSAKKNNGTLGPIWTIGSDYPQMYLGTTDPDNPTAPTVVLTSMVKRFDVAVYQIMSACVIDRTDITGLTLFGLYNGGLYWEIDDTLLGHNWEIPTAYKEILLEIEEGIMNGTWIVPTDYPWI